MPVSRERAIRMAQAGRSRWRIENNTYNTLKNQGYHSEHNYGHGKVNLSSVLAIWKLLAFLVDLVQQVCCRLCQSWERKHKTRRQLWQRMRSSVDCFVYGSFDQLFGDSPSVCDQVAATLSAAGSDGVIENPLDLFHSRESRAADLVRAVGIGIAQQLGIVEL